MNTRTTIHPWAVRLRAIWKKSGLTQVQIAERTNGTMTTTQVCHYLTGRCRGKYIDGFSSKWMTLARALGVKRLEVEK